MVGGRSQVLQPGGEFTVTALELVTRERIESVSKHFFTEIWGLGEGSRPRGAPSYEYKKRLEARDALVKAFLEQYYIGKAPTGDSGKRHQEQNEGAGT